MLNIFKQLEQIAPFIPSPIFWVDLNFRTLGANDLVFEVVGAPKREDVIGKYPHEYYPKEIADALVENTQRVIQSGKKFEFEEMIQDITTGRARYFKAIRAPLFDESGAVVGVIGTSIEITAEKEAEQLKLDNKRHETEAQEQAKFRKIVGQMAHDIRSPLSTIKTIAQTATELPEDSRVALRRADISMEDIVNHMLTHYKPNEAKPSENNQRQFVLVSAALSEIASERRYKYQNSPIQFEFVVTNPPINNFVFVQIEPRSFYRMISNLINNSAESLPKAGGKITVTLISNVEWVEIVIKDNGKGMSHATLEKLRQGKIVASNKKQGYGMGIQQVFDTLESNLGKFQIYSNNDKQQPNRGTAFRIRLPKAVTQQWIATEIKIRDNDTIIIVDDDSSIHSAWDARLKHILEKIPTIRIKHFTDGEESLQFMDWLNDKHNVLLLSDYELIGQDLNGLSIIKQSKIKRAILVTSYYADSQIRKEITKIGSKLLPKDIVYSVPITVERSILGPGQLVSVHMVFLDDEVDVINKLVADYYSNLLVDVYYNPFEFLKEVDKYPRDTKIILDKNYYDNGELIAEVSGTTIAKELHEKGYTKLYVCSWERYKVPEYVTFILKTDRDTMAHLDEL